MPRIVKLCVPGNVTTIATNKSLQKLIGELYKHPDYDFDVARDVKYEFSPYMFSVRAQLLGIKITDSLDVLPWYGEEPYDDILWIDNDMKFEPWMAFKLFDNPHPVTAGGYLASSRQDLCAGTIRPSTGTVELIKGIDWNRNNEEFLPCALLGMGFMSTKYGVLEKTKRPWFDHLYVDSRYGRGVEMSGEDLSFCVRVNEAGFQPYMDLHVTPYLKHVKPVELTIHDLISTGEVRWKGIFSPERSLQIVKRYRHLVVVGSEPDTKGLGKYYCDITDRKYERTTTLDELLKITRDPYHAPSIIVCPELTADIHEIDFGTQIIVLYGMDETMEEAHSSIDQKYREKPFADTIPASFAGGKLKDFVWRRYQTAALRNSMTVDLNPERAET